MTAPPAWGGKPLTSTDWADDVDEEEAVVGTLQVRSRAPCVDASSDARVGLPRATAGARVHRAVAVQAPAAIKVDEQAFPSLGAQPKGKKRGKGRPVALGDFQAQGATFSSRDRTAQILSSLPTHASGIEHGDPGHYRSGARHGLRPTNMSRLLCVLCDWRFALAAHSG